MASRSTRTKIKFQADKMLNKAERIQEHMKFIDDLAAGQSEYITTNLPGLVAVSEEYLKMLTHFRNGL